MRRFALSLLVSTLLAPAAAEAGACPQPLENALRLVLVTTQSMHTPVAQIRRYERTSPADPWRMVGDPEPAVIGLAGLGWGATFLSARRNGEPEKFEGDRRTPAGFFRLGASFGFSGSPAPGYLTLKAGETVCVDDPSSEHYNTIKPRSAIGARTSGEDMRLIPLYRRGMLVDYPSDRAGKRGSCIFVHVWKAPGSGTLGCVALPEPRVAALQSFAGPGDAVLGILPTAALSRFAECLRGAMPNGRAVTPSSAELQ